MEKDAIDLLTLQKILRAGIEEMLPGKVWVKAEIASASVKAGGHCYLDLTQDDGTGTLARARAVIWRSRYGVLASYFQQATGGPIKAGITVLVRVQINYSELYGLSLVIDDIDAQTSIGEKELARRRVVERLSAEGLLEKQKSLQMSPLPYSIAIISAPGAAGLGDFLNHLQANAYGFAFSTTLFDAVMQGESAPASICDAFERVECSDARFDVVLLLRGGGSASDLECFDDYDIAFAIANCPIPVYTAIGHDKDFHVADMAAYAYVKTPTALADEMIDAFAMEDERVESYVRRLRVAFLLKIQQMESKVDALAQRIAAADPRRLLERGYTLVCDSSGVVMKSAAGVQPGDKIKVMLADASLDCTIDAKNGRV